MGVPSVCETVWIQNIGPDLYPNCLQNNQQTTLVGKDLNDDLTICMLALFVLSSIVFFKNCIILKNSLKLNMNTQSGSSSGMKSSDWQEKS